VSGCLAAVARRLVRLPADVVVLLLKLWQVLVSPVYGQTCRFYPSCSSYALEAVDRHGLLRGGWLALRRLGRCHPWNPGGVDPVPPRVRVASPSPPGGPPTERSTNPAAATVADHRPPRRAA
jgi:putative membrane protein insertion efficiency factor